MGATDRDRPPVDATIEHQRHRARDDSWHDVVAGIGGAGVMAAAFAMPFMRWRRNRWGLDADTAAEQLPGDELVPDPTWQWTHGIEIKTPATEAWPWVAQIGADRAGFYSYQWLENLVGCDIDNADSVHPEWRIEQGDGLVLHPKMPPLPIVQVEADHFFVAHQVPDPRTDLANERWITASWLFLVRPLAQHRCRVISRYRCAISHDLTTRLQFGPMLIEPVGFAMDRRMLRGIKRRAERSWSRR